MKYRLICKNIATLGPVGLLPMPGTCATLCAIPLAYLCTLTGFYGVFALIITVCSFFVIKCALPLFVRKDPQEVVIDEVVGCLWVLYAAQWSWLYVAAVFLLFRFFDITKIGGIRFFERLSGAWGVLADDCVAALYAYGVLIVYRSFL